MAKLGEYKFEIDTFTPLTLPMKRLHEYVGDLVNLFGNEANVHFLRVDKGSACPVVLVDGPAIVKVERRLLAVKTGDASRRAMAAFASLNDKLLEDNATANVTSSQGKLLYFPGKEREASPEIGPIFEPGSIEGEVIGVAGRDETVQIYLREGERMYTCTGNKEKARALAQYLFEGRVRIFGEGRWKRNKTGKWELERFAVDNFIPMKTDSAEEVAKRLRSIQVPGLSGRAPLSILEEIRAEVGEGS